MSQLKLLNQYIWMVYCSYVSTSIVLQGFLYAGDVFPQRPENVNVQEFAHASFAWYSSCTAFKKSTIFKIRQVRLKTRHMLRSPTNWCRFAPIALPGSVLSLSWMCRSLSKKCCTAVSRRPGGAWRGLNGLFLSMSNARRLYEHTHRFVAALYAAHRMIPDAH